MIGIYMREAEVRLVERVAQLKADSMAWRLVHFRFGLLQDIYRSEYQRKIVMNVIKDHLNDSDGGLFMLSDGDVAVLVAHVQRQQIEKLVFQLRYLFSDDPLAYTIDGLENPEFFQVYDLSVNWAEGYQFAKSKLVQSARRDGSHPDAAKMVDGQPSAASGPKTLTPTRLAELEKELPRTDLSRVLRRQPIVAFKQGGELRKVFDEFYINIPHLQKLLMSDVNLTGNRWLFKYLTQLLDQRMLETLGRRPSMYFEIPASLNLNIDTILSDRFVEFDNLIKPATRVSVVIEIQIADVFANVDGFLRARDAIQKMGYRVCLDGLTHYSFTQVEREKLGFDLAKLQWHTDMETLLDDEEKARFRAMINRYGPNRLILCRCDDKTAVDFGRAFGIPLFQGRYLDYLLNPTAKVVN